MQCILDSISMQCILDDQALDSDIFLAYNRLPVCWFLFLSVFQVFFLLFFPVFSVSFDFLFIVPNFSKGSLVSKI